MNAVYVLLAVVVFLVVLFLISAIKVAREYERGIVFRLGRLLPEPKGPGLFVLIPIVDRMVKVDLRTITLNIPPQEVITKDNVPVRVNAVAYFRIVEPKDAIVQVENFMRDLAESADDAALGPRPARARRAALRSGRRSTRSCRASSTRRPSRGGSRSPRWRSRTSRSRRACSGRWRARPRPSASGARRSSTPRRVPGGRAAEGRCARDRGAPDRAAAALPADAARDRRRDNSTIIFPAPIDLIKPFLDRGGSS